MTCSVTGGKSCGQHTKIVPLVRDLKFARRISYPRVPRRNPSHTFERNLLGFFRQVSCAVEVIKACTFANCRGGWPNFSVTETSYFTKLLSHNLLSGVECLAWCDDWCWKKNSYAFSLLSTVVNFVAALASRFGSRWTSLATKLVLWHMSYSKEYKCRLDSNR